MDIWHHLETKRLRAETYKFNDNNDEQQGDRNMTDVFRELEGLLQKQLKQYWEIRSLQQYLENEKVPRGLRINKTPAQDLLGDRFEEEWNTLLLSHSVSLTKLVIKRRTEILSDLNGKIMKLKEQIEKLPKNEEYQNWQDRLCKGLDKIENEIIIRKGRKYTSFQQKRHIEEVKENTDILRDNIPSNEDILVEDTQTRYTVPVNNRYDQLLDQQHFLDHTPAHHRTRTKHKEHISPIRNQESHTHPYNLRHKNYHQKQVTEDHHYHSPQREHITYPQRNHRDPRRHYHQEYTEEHQIKQKRQEEVKGRERQYRRH